jgi:hypothetical protein
MAINRKRTVKITFWILAAFLTLSLLVAYLHYLDLKKVFLQKVSEKAALLIGQGVHIEDLSVSSFLSANLYGIAINNPEGFTSGDLLRIGRVRLDVRLRPLLKRELSIKRIVFYSPELSLVTNAKGKWNISDVLLRQLSTRSTTRFEVDELRIDSGTIEFNRNPTFRSNQINLVFENISSGPGTRTGIKGTIGYAGNSVDISGWTSFNQVPVKVNLSISSRDFVLSQLRRFFERYKIDPTKMRLSFNVQAEGDTEKGFHIISGLFLKGFRSFSFAKNLMDIQLSTDGIFSLKDYSLALNQGSLLVNGTSAATFRGKITRLNEKPSYVGDIKLDRLDLSGFHFIKEMKVTGILSSENIRAAGDFGSKTLAVSGGLRLREGGIESSDAIIQKVDADIFFSSARERTIKGEASAEIMRLREYALKKPVDVKITATLRATRERIDGLSFLHFSPLEVQVKDNMTASVGKSDVTIEGTFEDNTFEGKGVFTTKDLRLAGQTISRLKANSGIDYRKTGLLLTDLAIETEDATSSAAILSLTAPREETGYKLDVKDLNVAYQKRGVLLEECDLYLTLQPDERPVSGDLRFSARNILFNGIGSRNVSGAGKFGEKDFSLDIQHAEMFGGRLKLAAEGKISENIFPIKTKVLVEGIDLASLSNSLPKSVKIPYSVAGSMKRATFQGILNSQTNITGSTFLEVGKVSFSDSNTGKNIIKDASLRADLDFEGKDLTFKAAAAAGNILPQLSGTVKDFLGKERSLQIKGILPDVSLTEIRNSFWDVFPDSLLYAGLDGAVSSDFSIDYSKDGLSINGNVQLKDCFLKGEYGEYFMGPINGPVPIAYGRDRNEGEAISLPSFEKPQFDSLMKYYAKEEGGKDFKKITIGSLDYGFPLLRDITLLVKQRGSVLNIDRFSASIFGGRFEGSGLLDLSKGLDYRAGFMIQGLSLATLCERIEPIRGFMSGKVDGIASFKGSGTGLSHLIGMADFWTYSSGNEKTMISKEFLQKIGGPSLKTYLGNRRFNKGIMSLYLQKGDLIFKELEISNRNFFGVTDLSVKVVPFNNRIALDKFLWSVTEAAQRPKEKK